ncbi:MAG: rhodanese-like domain-containing protein [Mycobacteriales bacterium]
MSSGELPGVAVTDVDPAAAVLDVREDDEWAAGHIDGAVHIPMGEVTARLGEIEAGQPVAVVCRSGGRSAQVTAYLVGNGIEARNVVGGMQAWQAAGRPMIAAGAGPPAVI